ARSTRRSAAMPVRRTSSPATRVRAILAAALLATLTACAGSGGGAAPAPAAASGAASAAPTSTSSSTPSATTTAPAGPAVPVTADVPVIFVHGITSDPVENWGALLPRLARGRAVYPEL